MSVPGYRAPRAFARETVACICGKPRKETQKFCRRCFDALPAKTKYDLMDGDSAKRMYAMADADHLLRSMATTGKWPAEQLTLEAR